MKYLNLQEVKDIYNKGKNITQYLRKKLNQPGCPRMLKLRQIQSLKN